VSSLIEQGLEDGSKDGAPLSDLVTEFMVDMSCEGCVKSVRTKLEPLEGVKSVDVDLGNQVVRVLGSATVKNLSAALAQSGRKARLIGQGLPESGWSSMVL
jgi:copper chaperone for superoxide dismutase